MRKNLLRCVLTLPLCVSVASINASEINIIKPQGNYIKPYIKTQEAIKEVNSLRLIIDDLNKNNLKKKTGEEYKGWLHISDLDETLLARRNILFSSRYEKELNGIEDILLKKYPQYIEKYKHFEKMVYKTEPEMLTEKGWGGYVRYVEKHGGKVLIVSAIDGGEIDGEMMADIRAEKLNGYEIIPESFQGVPSAWLGEEGKSPYFSNKGVLASVRTIWNAKTGKEAEDANKAVALALFFTYLYRCSPNHKFHTIVMIDDKKYNLIDVRDYIDRLNDRGADIRFLGYHYTRANDIPYPLPFSYERAYFQLEYLINNEIFLSDEAAEYKMRLTNYKLPEDVKKSIEELIVKIEKGKGIQNQKAKSEDPKRDVKENAKNNEKKEDKEIKNSIQAEEAKNDIQDNEQKNSSEKENKNNE